MDRISQIHNRINQIESTFNPSAQETKSFDELLQEAQGSTTKIDMSNAMGNNPMMAMNQLMSMNPINSMMTMNSVTGINPAMSMNSVMGPMGGPSPLGMQIASAAGQFKDKQYWPNACAHAVNDVLKSLGIDINSQVKNNPDWVPNYENLGQKVTSKEQLQPGDLVIYCNEIGEGGYDHIGIYAGNGMAYNVSTSRGYTFALTPVGDTFQEGRRLG